MAPKFSYQGASGNLYAFGLVDIDNPRALPWQGGLFVFADFVPNPIYFGEADNLYGAIARTPRWRAAQKDYDAKLVYIHILDDAALRQQALADLLANPVHSAPMNRAG